MQKLAVWGGIGFVIFFIVQRPGAAGDGVRAVTSLVMSIANGFADFTSGLIP
ncbi:MAG: hypothetical protein ACRDUA_00925 [Micromonosporaceae bacterium]